MAEPGILCGLLVSGARGEWGLSFVIQLFSCLTDPQNMFNRSLLY
jgi:hypothetical protein